MTPELIGILGVGAALATLNIAIAAWLRADIRDVRTELRAEIHAVRNELKIDIQAVRNELKTDIQAVRNELKTDIQAVRTELGAEIRELRTDVHGLDQRSSRIEGVIEGLFVGMNGRGHGTPDDAGQERGEEAA